MKRWLIPAACLAGAFQAFAQEAKMREVPGIDIPAGGKTELKPGGYHLMLLDLKAPLKDGERVPLELRFERSETVSMNVPVKALGATGHKGH